MIVLLGRSIKLLGIMFGKLWDLLLVMLLFFVDNRVFYVSLVVLVFRYSLSKSDLGKFGLFFLMFYFC